MSHRRLIDPKKTPADITLDNVKHKLRGFLWRVAALRLRSDVIVSAGGNKERDAIWLEVAVAVGHALTHDLRYPISHASSWHAVLLFDIARIKSILSK